MSSTLDASLLIGSKGPDLHAVATILADNANTFWYLEDEIYRIGTPAMKVAMDQLHAALAAGVAALNLPIPARPKSGGGGK